MNNLLKGKFSNSFLFFVLVLILFFCVLTVSAEQKNNNITSEPLKLLNNAFNKNDSLFNKVIVVGDSRMSLIADDWEILKPYNFIFVAKSGMQIEWFENYAITQIEEILKISNYQYHVVINMGVNDLNNKNIIASDIARKYFKLYKNLSQKFPEVKIYLMSVNPVDEKIINEYWNNNRTNNKIEKFNDVLKQNLNKYNIENMYYCDSYNEINFKTYDGLHYTFDTNKKIVGYINNDCIKY